MTSFESRARGRRARAVAAISLLSLTSVQDVSSFATGINIARTRRQHTTGKVGSVAVSLLPIRVSAKKRQRHRHFSPCHAINVEEVNSDCGGTLNRDGNNTEGRKSAHLTSQEIEAIDDLVSQRALARSIGNYDHADELREQIETSHSLPAGFRIELTDIPRKVGGGSTWSVVPTLKESLEYIAQKGETSASVLQLSHAALGLATVSAEQDDPINTQQLDEIVQQALERMEKTGPTELRGRKAADAAFWFALSGISDELTNASKLLNALTEIAIEELERFGSKPSCRAKDVMHIVERLLASGISGNLVERLSTVAANCLAVKGYRGCNTSSGEEVVELLRNNKMDLHSDRPLLWLWRFSIRQRKQRSFLRGATRQYERFNSANRSKVDDSMQESATSLRDNCSWEDMFDDPLCPAVIDIGCGMGVSLHGLATMTDQVNVKGQDTISQDDIDVNWMACNFVGVDLSRLAIGFANAVASRSKVNGKLHYVVDSAESFLERLSTYPGEIKLIMIQFPTPYRLQQVNSDDVTEDEEAESKGNQQLPKHPYENFMVTSELLDAVGKALIKGSGKLLLQSNCEDVAVYMRNLATTDCSFRSIESSSPRKSFEESKTRIPQRTLDYVAMGGARALGDNWFAEPLLPRRGATETEVACFLETTPVHRCLLEPS